MNPDIQHALIRVAPFLFILLGIWAAVRRKRFTTQDLGLQAPSRPWLAFAWCIFFPVFALAIEWILFENGLLEVSHWHHTLAPSIIRITGMIILAPVAEELLFRGMILHKLTQWKVNQYAAIFLQAILFMMLHGFAFDNTLSSNIGIAQTFVDACLFAYARLSTRSIYTSIVMHATGNLIATLEMFLL